MRDALRFISCGCEGGGKSTLTARLLEGAGHNSGNCWGEPGPLPEDALPPCFGHAMGMDAPYRFFATARRNFFAADTSERGMAAAACTADLAVLVVDAAKGLEPRARTQLRIASMFGVRHAVLAINKMDAAGWDKEIFNSIVADFRALVVDFGFMSAEAVPLCALSGDNVSFRSARSAWYGGPALLEYLETVGDPGAASLRPFRMAVREIATGNAGFSGRIASGSVAIGASVVVRPDGGHARVTSITAQSGARDAAVNGDIVTITLDRDLDIARGQVLSSIDDPIHASDQFEASVLCLPGHHLMPGRPYVMRVHAARTEVTITDVKYKLDVSGGSHLAAKVLAPDEIGEVTLYTSQPVAFEPYGQSRALGAFTLVDGRTNEIAGLGMVNFALRRASNIHWQALDVDKAARARLKSQQPSCIWLTGLSGSGKSTIANLLEKRLGTEGRHTYLLDGDNVRHGLNRDLGFSEADRVENIRRVAEVAKLMVDAGLIVIVSFISPFGSEREFARSLFEPGEFREVFVDAPLDVCEKRDAKGLYAKARRGELANFTGIDSAYEIPAAPDVRLDTSAHQPEECVAQLMKALKLTP